jgi:hypothetical protein
MVLCQRLNLWTTKNTVDCFIDKLKLLHKIQINCNEWFVVVNGFVEVGLTKGLWL